MRLPYQEDTVVANARFRFGNASGVTEFGLGFGWIVRGVFNLCCRGCDQETFLMFGILRRFLPAALVGLISISAWPSDKPPDAAHAAGLNNLGVAYMNQQRMDKAVEEFNQALKVDPALTVAELNKGIALLNLQKLPEAQAALDTAAAKDPSNPR
ncbi:MAG: tetratricopeptide repeat protein, partial [Candidatus Korobacteraceae bacterium]